MSKKRNNPSPATATDRTNPEDFEHLAGQKRVGLLAEFWDFLKYNKKWWLLPIVLVLLVLGALVLLTSGAPAALPFVYTLF